MAHDINTAQRASVPRAQPPASTGIPFWDMMLSLSKASQQAMTGYASRAEQATQPKHGAARQTTSNVEVIPVGEETLNVGTRLIAGETTRVRRIVVETPVEQAVSLREERVVVERRKPTATNAAATQSILSETAIEMSDSFEVVEVWKSMRVTEEVVLRREVTQRHETVRDTVRRDEVVVEQAKRRVPTLRHEAATARHDQNIASVPPANKMEPAHLASDLNKAAEQFEMSAGQKEKAIATLHETLEPEKGVLKAEQSLAASASRAQEAKAAAELAKAPVLPKRSEASATQGDKGNPAFKS